MTLKFGFFQFQITTMEDINATPAVVIVIARSGVKQGIFDI